MLITALLYHLQYSNKHACKAWLKEQMEKVEEGGDMSHAVSVYSSETMRKEEDDKG